MKIVLIAIIWIFFIKASLCDNYDEEAWREAANFLNQGYNSSAIPCEDFTNFACGKWSNEHAGKPEEVNEIFGTLYWKIAESILSVNEKVKTTPKYKFWVKKFFERCLVSTDEENRNETTKELFIILVKILGLPPILNRNESSSTRNIWNFLGYLQRHIPDIKIFFSANLKSISMDKSSLQFLHQSFDDDLLHLGTAADDLYLLADVFNIHLDEREMLTKIREMIKLERELIRIFNDTEKEVAVVHMENNVKDIKSENVVMISDLKEFHPNSSWSEYFRGLFTQEQYDKWNESKPFIVRDDVKVFELFDSTIAKFDPDTVFNYIFYKSMKKLATFFTADYYANSTSDIKCTQMAVKLFKSASTRILFDHLKYDALEWRNDIQFMADTIFSALKIAVIGSDWLDTEDKVAIVDKINHLSFHPVVPEWYKNDTEIERRTTEIKPESSTMENYFYIMKQKFHRDLDYLVGLGDMNQSGDEPDLDIRIHSFGAFDKMKLGYAVPPWYYPKYPLALKYGYLGVTLGHELMLHFDAARIQKVQKGGKNWLKPETVQFFLRQRDCLIKQFSSSCTTNEEQCFNERNLISKAMADIEGLKIAYTAYKFASQTIEEEPPLPGFSDLTGDQIFFQTAARTRCSAVKGVSRILPLENEQHLPKEVPIEVLIRNFPVFAKIFGCSANNLYRSSKACGVWGSYNVASLFL